MNDLEKLIESANTIKAYCESQDKCDNCVFHVGGFFLGDCKLKKNVPMAWEIENEAD